MCILGYCTKGSFLRRLIDYMFTISNNVCFLSYSQRYSLVSMHPVIMMPAMAVYLSLFTLGEYKISLVSACYECFNISFRPRLPEKGRFGWAKLSADCGFLIYFIHSIFVSFPIKYSCTLSTWLSLFTRPSYWLLLKNADNKCREFNCRLQTKWFIASHDRKC